MIRWIVLLAFLLIAGWSAYFWFSMGKSQQHNFKEEIRKAINTGNASILRQKIKNNIQNDIKEGKAQVSKFGKKTTRKLVDKVLGEDES